MRILSKIPVRFSALALLPLLSLLATSCAPSAYNSRGGLGFFGVLYLIMAIYAVISLLKQDWSLGKKLLWGAIIWFFPIGGSIIYLLFSGRNG
ncbi:MAG: PLDc_N domain-containing protein [Hymenobacter sp.]|nr:MAG: PLDc_N domain-containing protein [Hymenobacter sp.]